MIDHPLIYCNGDSYSDEDYHPSLKNNTYAYTVGEHLQGFVINHAKSKSCNRRILRTSVHDLIHQRQLNPEQKIIALISLSFDIRSEFWIEDANPTRVAESNFQTHIFTREYNWRELLLAGKDIDPTIINNRPDKKFFDKYSQGRAYYYSPYAERANLLCDCLMFQALMNQLNIQFLMFQGPKAEPLESEYLIDFFKSQLQKENFFDFETFGFVDWCYQQQRFEHLDIGRPETAHYGPDAHRAFAKEILIPHLEKYERRH